MADEEMKNKKDDDIIELDDEDEEDDDVQIVKVELPSTSTSTSTLTSTSNSQLLKSQITRLEKRNQSLQRYNDDLLGQVRLMQAKLHLAKEYLFASVGTQTEDVSNGSNHEDSDLNANSNSNKNSLKVKQELDQFLAGIKETAEDYVYDEASKTFYSKSTGWYYYPESSAFFNPNDQSYYKYDQEKDSYTFLCRLDEKEENKLNNNNNNNNQNHNNNNYNNPKHSSKKMSKLTEEIESDEEEEGEIVDKDSQSDSSQDSERDSRKKSRRKKSKRKSDDEDDDDDSTSKSRKKKKKKRKHSKEKRRRRRNRSRDSSSSSPEVELSPCKNNNSVIESKPFMRNQARRGDSPPEVMVFDSNYNSLKSTRALNQIAPVRLIVQEAESLDLGSLLLVTCMGGKVGQHANCTVTVPDGKISQLHAEISYDQQRSIYTIQDLISRNGTYLNEQKLNPLERTPLYHGDQIRLADTCRLLAHIHQHRDFTCDECEPTLITGGGQKTTEGEEGIYRGHTKSSIKSLKRKYGLDGFGVTNGTEGSVLPSKYQDRAAQRQRDVGSSNPYEKTAAGSALDMPLDKKNKGFQMLEKMGWKKGKGLGRTVDTSTTEPINIEIRNERTGLGFGTH